MDQLIAFIDCVPGGRLRRGEQLFIIPKAATLDNDREHLSFDDSAAKTAGAIRSAVGRVRAHAADSTNRAGMTATVAEPERDALRELRLCLLFAGSMS